MFLERQANGIKRPRQQTSSGQANTDAVGNMSPTNGDDAVALSPGACKGNATWRGGMCKI